MQKTTLIYVSSSPFVGTSAKEALDLALVLGTFEQPVSLCFTDAGLSVLLSGQEPEKRQGKHLFKLLDGLEFYDIENVYVKQEEVQPIASQLWEGITALDTDQWQVMLTQHNAIYRF